MERNRKKNSLLRRLKERGTKYPLLMRELSALHYAYRDPGTGMLPKIIILLALGYALSPIDLIPDFIPLLGYIDDLVIIPALISLSIRLIPADVMHEARIKAEKEPVPFKRNFIFAAIIIAIWISLGAVLLRLVWKSS